MNIDERFAYLTHPDGTRFQVLVLDDEGSPVDSDIAAAAVAYQEYEAQKGAL